jgi:hypothetical protein
MMLGMSGTDELNFSLYLIDEMKVYFCRLDLKADE